MNKIKELGMKTILEKGLNTTLTLIYQSEIEEGNIIYYFHSIEDIIYVALYEKEQEKITFVKYYTEGTTAYSFNESDILIEFNVRN